MALTPMFSIYFFYFSYFLEIFPLKNIPYFYSLAFKKIFLPSSAEKVCQKVQIFEAFWVGYKSLWQFAYIVKINISL